MFVLKRSCRPNDRLSGRDALVIPLPDGSEITIRLRNTERHHAFLLVEAPDHVRVRRGEQLTARAGEGTAGDCGPVG